MKKYVPYIVTSLVTMVLVFIVVVAAVKTEDGKKLTFKSEEAPAA